MTSSNWQAIRSYAYDLVAEKKVSYALLNEEEKSILTGLIINNSKPITAHEYITEADKKDELPYLLGDYLSSLRYGPDKSVEKLEEMVRFMSEKAYEYASNEIDKILQDIEVQFEEDKKFYDRRIKV